MADAEQPQRYDQEFYWLHCAGCGKGLWKRYPDHFEMTISPRGRQKRTINVALEAAPAVKVRCEKCGLNNVPI